MTEQLEAIIENLYVYGFSDRTVSEVMEVCYDLDVSKSKVSDINVETSQVVQEVLGADLSDRRYSIILVDATYMPIRIEGTDSGHVRHMANLIVLGINEETGRAELLYSDFHYQEDTATYKEVFENLRNRGLKVAPMLALSDAQRGLHKAFCEVFPSTFASKCMFHALKNAFDKLNDSDFDDFKALAQQAYAATDAQERRTILDAMMKTYGDLPTMMSRINSLEKSLENFYPKEIFDEIEETKINTSNLIERCNRNIKNRTKIQNSFPNIEAARRISIKRLVRHLDKLELIVEPEQLQKTRRKWDNLQENLQEAIYKHNQQQQLQDHSPLGEKRSPLLYLDLESVPFEFEGAIHTVSFLVAQLQTEQANRKENIGIYPVFNPTQEEFEKTLEIFLERGLNPEMLLAIECCDDHKQLREAIKTVFAGVPLQADGPTLIKSIVSKTTPKYRDGLEACIEAIANENILDQARETIELTSSALAYHNQFEAKVHFDERASELLTLKEIGIKRSDQHPSLSQSRLTFSQSLKNLKPLEEALGEYYQTRQRRSIAKGKVWFDQKDVDLLFEKLAEILDN